MVGEGCSHEEDSADGAGQQTVEYGQPWTSGIGETSGIGTAGEGGDVLQANKESCDGGADSEVAFDVAGKDGKRHADAEVSNEAECDVGKDAEGFVRFGGSF